MSYPLTMAKKNSYGGTRNLSSIKYIVLHYTGVNHDSAKNEVKFFATGNTRSAGAHFFVGQDGDIQQSIPLKYIAWSVGDYRNGKGAYYGKCTNSNSVSIEMCDQLYKDASADQINAVRNVIKYIKTLCPNIIDVIRHYDVTTKHCLPVEETELLTEDGWKSLKDISKGENVCSYDPNSDTLRFSPVLDVVEPHVDEVFDNHYFSATKDHRMWLKPNCANSKKYREVLWGDALTGKSLYAVKSGAELEAAGLPLTNDEIRLLVWIQGDGHYIKDNGKIRGLEFHLSKQRKIVRVCDVLEENDIEYRVSYCENGSQHIRVYDTDVVEWAESWLDNKQFTFELVNMSQGQFEAFKSELLVVDGCKGEKSEVYTSVIPQNLDVVQAVCATHGVRTYQTTLGKNYKCAVGFCTTNHTFSGRGKTETRNAVVSCVTVPTGYILVRQNHRTFIVGNCPARYLTNDKWRKLKSAVTDGAYTEPVKISDSSEPLAVDGYIGQKTVRRWQEIMHTPQDGEISGQLKTLKKYHLRFTSSAIEYGSGGSTLIKAVQKAVGTEQDGQMGSITIKAIQTRIGVYPDGYFGEQTAKALQARLNTGAF